MQIVLKAALEITLHISLWIRLFIFVCSLMNAAAPPFFSIAIPLRRHFWHSNEFPH